jgi:hypothetical protein
MYANKILVTLVTRTSRLIAIKNSHLGVNFSTSLLAQIGTASLDETRHHVRIT